MTQLCLCPNCTRFFKQKGIQCGFLCSKYDPRPILGAGTIQKINLIEVENENILPGWPDNMDTINTHVYLHMRDELSDQDEIVYRRSSSVIPKTLRSEVMGKRHQLHIGTEGCL